MDLNKAIKTIATFSTIEDLTSVKHNFNTVSRLEKEFETTLTPELKHYIESVAPKTDLYFEAEGNPIRLYSADNLKKIQDGYNYNPVTNTKIDGWPGNYFIIADEGGDPIIIDLNSKNTSVLKFTHGSGSWEYGETIADSIGQFLFHCASRHHALTHFENKDWYIKESSDLIKEYGDVPPPWVIAPNFHPYSMGWRMGFGETHIMVLSEWLDQNPLSLEERIAYLHKYPAPARWYDWIIHFLWKIDTTEFEEADYQPYLDKLKQLGFKNTNDFFKDLEREDLE